MYARCPGCRRTRIVVTRRKGKSKEFTLLLRLHHEPWPATNLHERGQNPLCWASGRPLPDNAVLSRL